MQKSPKWELHRADEEHKKSKTETDENEENLPER